MLEFKLSELKALNAAELQDALDRALSAMLYPLDDPSYKEGDEKLCVVDDAGTTPLGGAYYGLVALRYIWFLYKKATIPGYVSG